LDKKIGFKDVALFLVNAVVVICGLGMIVFGALNAVAGRSVIAGTCLTGGVVLLLFGTVDRFESIKGLGIEAKVARLDATIHTAEDLLKRLREVAEMFGGTTLRTASALGRWDSAPSVEENYALVVQVKDLLLRLGSSPETIRRMLEPWMAQNIFDCFNYVIADYWTAFDALKTDLGNENMHAGANADPAKVERFNAMNDWKKTVQGRIHDRAQPPLEAWQAICEEPDPARWPQLPEPVRAALKTKIATWDPEVRYLLERHDFRTPSMWFRLR
jgi:hypothetical protein